MKVQHRGKNKVAQLAEANLSGDGVIEGSGQHKEQNAEHVVITYPNKEGEPTNKPTNRVKFMLKEANEDGRVPDDREEIEWTTSETTGKEVINWIMKGFFLLDVSREGSSKFDTKYTLSPHL